MASDLEHDLPVEKEEKSASSEDNSDEASKDDVNYTNNEAFKDDVDDNNNEADDGLRGFKLVSIMSGLVFTAFLVQLDTSILVTAIPKITTDFASLTNVGWYGAAYMLANAALQPLTGKFYADFHLKWTYITFIAIFEVGSVLCGAATSSNMLIVGRAVAGMGVAGIQNGAFTIIAAAAPMQRRPTLIGIAMGVGQFGLVCGPLIGGALTEYTTWRWCFYINLPCGALVVALLCFIRIPEPVKKPKPMSVLKSVHRRFDLIGFALFAPACIMFLLAIQWGGNTYSWSSSVIIGLLVGSVANAIVWGVWDKHKKDQAIVPVLLMKQRNVWSGCLTFSVLMSTNACTSYYLPIYFQSVRGNSPTISGVHMLPSIISQLVGAILGGKLVGRFGYYLPFSVFCAVLMTVGYGLVSTFSPTTSIGAWIGYQILFAFGRGIGSQMPIIAVQNTMTPAQIPIAMAMIMATSTFSSAMFLGFSDTIFTNSLSSQLAGSLPQSTVQKVVESGGVGFRQFLTPSELGIVISAYATSVDRVFYMLAALGAVCFFSCWGMGWVDIRKKSSGGSAA